MRVLLTGAAGNIGRALRPPLRERVSLLRIADFDELEPEAGEETCRFDITDFDAVRDACREIDAVVHLAGIPKEAAFDRIAEVNLRGTYNVYEAARLAGVRTNRVLLSVYIVAGLICAVAAWMLIGRIASASPQAGGTANLDSITAVVIGGTSLFGGRGLVVGTLFGALIVGVLRNGLTLAGVDVLWQDFAVGILIIAAVAIDQWIRKVRA